MVDKILGLLMQRAKFFLIEVILMLHHAFEMSRASNSACLTYLKDGVSKKIIRFDLRKNYISVFLIGFD